MELTGKDREISRQASYELGRRLVGVGIFAVLGLAGAIVATWPREHEARAPLGMGGDRPVTPTAPTREIPDDAYDSSTSTTHVRVTRASDAPGSSRTTTRPPEAAPTAPAPTETEPPVDADAEPFTPGIVATSTTAHNPDISGIMPASPTSLTTITTGRRQITTTTPTVSDLPPVPGTVGSVPGSLPTPAAG
jgi:hypothetical protein